jgi:heme/copper-type cytochrome/quinol oxidase subunit 3
MNQPPGGGESLLRSLRLGATYWHYLLLVWLAMFALLLMT